MTTGVGWHEVVSRANVRAITWSPEFSPAAVGYVLIMNSRVWHELKREQRKSLLSAAKEVSIEFQKIQIEQEKVLMSEAHKMGVQVTEVSPKAQDIWREIAGPLLSRFRDEAPHGDPLLGLLSK